MFLRYDRSLKLSDVEQAFIITKTNREAENIYFINKVASHLGYTTLVDIGCNFGQFCSAVMDSFQRIIVVDANSKALCYAKKLIKHPDVKFLNAAVVPREFNNKFIKFKIPHNNTGLGSITFGEDYDFEINALKVKEILRDIKHLKSIIKIDVEGIENQIINDILETQIHNECIFAFEVLDDKSGVAVDQVFYNKGYSFITLRYSFKQKWIYGR